MVGSAVSSITRIALTLGGAHGIFKGSRLEQLFRDGCPGRRFSRRRRISCLWNMGIYELGLDPADVLAADQALTARTRRLTQTVDHRQSPPPDCAP